MDGLERLKTFGETWFKRVGKKSILVGVSVTATVLVGGWVLYVIKLKTHAPPKDMLEAEEAVVDALADYTEINEDPGLKLIRQGSGREVGVDGEEGWTISFHGRARHRLSQLKRVAEILVFLGTRAIEKLRLEE